MSEYYLISQLPSLDGLSENLIVPISYEKFLELCNSLLSERVKNKVNSLTITPPVELEKSGSSLIDAWNDGERNLRIALAKARAEKMNKPINFANKYFSTELIKLANTAVEIDNPLEAETFLNNYRLKFLESLRPMDNFSEDFVYYYGLKLKLILKMRKYDTKLGEEAYKSVYNSILNGENLEAR